MLSGAAGLRIGHALLAPGRLTRRQSLVLATRDSAVLLYGVTAMLLVAAAVEAFWSSATWLPAAVKYGVAAVCWAGRARVSSRSRDDVQVDALAVRLRPRTPMEAADLGVRLCQSAARSVYRCYVIVALPVVALALASHRDRRAGCRALVMWCAKPWLDRTILFVLSRAAFGQRTTPADVWRAQRQVWWSQLLFTWTVRRLSPWRSLTAAGLSARRAFDLERAARAFVRSGSRNMGAALDDDAGVQLGRNGADVCAGLAGVLARAGGTDAGRPRSAVRRGAGRRCRWPSRSPTRSRCCFSNRSTWPQGSRCT